jgi:hypothetical protein
MVTAIDLARDLQVDATSLRRWLRGLVREGHPIVRRHRPWERWQFTQDEADVLARAYETAQGREVRAGNTHLSVGLKGTEVTDATLHEFAAFVAALDDLFEAASSEDDGGERRVVLRRVTLGSPLEIIVLIPFAAGAVGAAAVATNKIIVAINTALQGRRERAKTNAEIDAIKRAAEGLALESEAKVRATDAKTRQINAKTDAFLSKQRRDDLARVRPAADAERVQVNDRTGVMAEVAGGELDSAPARAAVAILATSPLQIEKVTVRYAHPRRRGGRR